jgi:nitrite reductase/ring-hydroxylating ferredoxin subunit
MPTTRRSPASSVRTVAISNRFDSKGCPVCPWHGSRYDVKTGRMVLGPQGIFAKIPGLGEAFKLLTQVLPLGRGTVVERNGKIYVA